MQPFYIYFILNKLTGKYYVGQTIQTPEERWVAHKSDARTKKLKKNHFHNSLRYYGFENFELRILFMCYDRKTLDEAETYFISLFQSNNPRFGYNGSSRGESPEPTEQTRAKMSEAGLGKKKSPEHSRRIALSLTGKTRPPDVVAKMIAGRKGKKRKPLSSEGCKKISDSHIGLRHTEETKAKMRKPHSEQRRLNIIESLRKRRERLEKENQVWNPQFVSTTPTARMDLPPRGPSGRFIKTGLSSLPNTAILLQT